MLQVCKVKLLDKPYLNGFVNSLGGVTLVGGTTVPIPSCLQLWRFRRNMLRLFVVFGTLGTLAFAHLQWVCALLEWLAAQVSYAKFSTWCGEEKPRHTRSNIAN
eukprot:2876977-Amphidinium_carterae.3